MSLVDERTLDFIKPGNYWLSLEIFECLGDLLKKDLVSSFSRTLAFHLNPVPEELIREHYKEHYGKVFYDWTIKAFLESEDGIVLRVYRGINIVNRVRNAIGNIDPQKAKSYTIRGRFSNDSFDIAMSEKRYLNNVIHASSSIEDAEREIRLWGDYLYW